MSNVKVVKVYLNRREQEIFSRVRDALGENDSGIFLYLLKRYAEEYGLIVEALQK